MQLWREHCSGFLYVFYNVHAIVHNQAPSIATWSQQRSYNGKRRVSIRAWNPLKDSDGLCATLCPIQLAKMVHTHFLSHPEARCEGLGPNLGWSYQTFSLRTCNSVRSLEADQLLPQEVGLSSLTTSDVWIILIFCTQLWNPLFKQRMLWCTLVGAGQCHKKKEKNVIFVSFAEILRLDNTVFRGTKLLLVWSRSGARQEKFADHMYILGCRTLLLAGTLLRSISVSSAARWTATNSNLKAEKGSPGFEARAMEWQSWSLILSKYNLIQS